VINLSCSGDKTIVGCAGSIPGGTVSESLNLNSTKKESWEWDMAVGKIEKFKPEELTGLRLELSNSAIDSWQAADIVSEFLTGRGYGTSPDRIRHALAGMGGVSADFERMQEALEKIAFVM
jgi:hypothetical protein